MRNIKYIVVHCSATSPTTSINSIQNYWKTVLKWRNPGYHYLLPYAGGVVKLHDEDKIANGVRGHNNHSIHVSYVGGVEGKAACDTRSPEQKETMLKLLLDLKTRYPNAEIVGHRDLSPDRDNDGVVEPHEWVKICPSFDVKKWLTVATRVA